jgi:hypothetical protein
VEEWFRKRRDLLVLIRYAYMAGNRDLEVIPAFEALRTRMARLAPRTSITVFRDHQLPLRGVVDDAFIQACLAAIPDGTEYVVAETGLTTAGGQSWFHHASGTSHGELRDSLERSRGKSVLVGEYPPFTDSDAVVTAYVPDPDGVVRPGAY